MMQTNGRVGGDSISKDKDSSVPKSREKASQPSILMQGQAPLPLATLVTIKNQYNSKSIQQNKFNKIMQFNMDLYLNEEDPSQYIQNRNKQKRNKLGDQNNSCIKGFAQNDEQIMDFKRKTIQMETGETKLIGDKKIMVPPVSKAKSYF